MYISIIYIYIYTYTYSIFMSATDARSWGRLEHLSWHLEKWLSLSRQIMRIPNDLFRPSFVYSRKVARDKGDLVRTICPASTSRSPSQSGHSKRTFFVAFGQTVAGRILLVTGCSCTLRPYRNSVLSWKLPGYVAM